MQDLNGKVAVVTGGASGIGLGMSRALAARNMKLVIADLDEQLLATVKQEFQDQGTEVATMRCDVSKHAEIQALRDLATSTFGAAHVLCNNAGVGIPTATHKMKLDDWRWIIDVDLWGPIYGVETFLPLMEEQGEGHINATSSMAGLLAGGWMGAYNVAKHGVVALMATLSRDLKGRRSPVTASVLCPGPINTNISRHSVEFRPGKAKPKTDGANAGKMASNIQEMLEKGMQPNEVGELVRDAIETGKFWIFTHPEMNKLLVRQTEALMDDQSLTKM